MTKSVGIIFHPAETQGSDCLADACSILDARGVPHWEVPRDAKAARDLLRSAQLLLTLGGDGTFMHGARLGAPAGIPVLGVNLGRLGFLTELEPRELARGLDSFFAGRYGVEERTVVSATLLREDRRLAQLLGINEVVILKAAQRLVRFEISVETQEVGTIDADGVLVASATGSTAYALAMGGPIMQPDVKGLLMVPMNPFALTVRPIVFPEGQALSIRLFLGEGILTADGFLNRRLRDGDTVLVEPYRRRLKVVRFGPRPRFFERLRDKIGWGTPLVPLR